MAVIAWQNKLFGADVCYDGVAAATFYQRIAQCDVGEQRDKCGCRQGDDGLILEHRLCWNGSQDERHVFVEDEVGNEMEAPGEAFR